MKLFNICCLYVVAVYYYYILISLYQEFDCIDPTFKYLMFSEDKIIKSNLYKNSLHYDMINYNRFQNEVLKLGKNDNMSHIGGSWISSAKNIVYRDNMLCLNLRNHKDLEVIYPHISKKYSYKDRSCIELNKNEAVMVENKNGQLQRYESDKVYPHKIGSIPRGLWLEHISFLKNITYFPNAICAEILKNKFDNENDNKIIELYEEECVEYYDGDLLDIIDGKFIVMKKKDNTYNNYFNLC